MLRIPSSTVADPIAWALVDSQWQGALIAATLRAAHVGLGHSTALAGLLGTAVAFALSILGSHQAQPAFPFSPFIVIGWFVSMIVLQIRLIGGWWVLHHRHGASTTSRWDEHTTRLRERFCILRPVRIVQAAARHIAVFGHRRPVIVVPAGTLAQLESHEVDAVLAHEFAHVLRHDYAINLLQTAVEAVLFFNPAIWLLARWVRTSREECCDELSAAVCGGAIEYAQILLALERRRTHRGQNLPSGSGGGNFAPAFDG